MRVLIAFATGAVVGAALVGHFSLVSFSRLPDAREGVCFSKPACLPYDEAKLLCDGIVREIEKGH